MARWLKNAPADVRVAERTFRPEPLNDALVFYGRQLPDHAMTREQLVDRWIRSAKRQLQESDPRVRQAALIHALGIAPADRVARDARRSSRTVLLAGGDAAVEAALKRGGLAVKRVAATPFDREAAAKIAHFDTYNRTEASQRVADIVSAVGQDRNAILIADGEWGLAALLAIAFVPIERAIVDAAQFDTTRDDMFVERLYIPGIRRAGDLQTAQSMSTAQVIVHNAGDGFALDGARIERRTLTLQDIVKLIQHR
jgi:hypothetical protein